MIKGRLGEVVDPTQRAWGYSMYSLEYSIAGLLGPLAGGFLSHSSVDTATATSEQPSSTLLTKYPFFLVGFLPSFLALVGLFLMRWIEEPVKFSLSNFKLRKYTNLVEVEEDVEMENFLDDDVDEGDILVTSAKIIASEDAKEKISILGKISGLVEPSSIIPILLYCCIASVNMLYITVKLQIWKLVFVFFSLGLSVILFIIAWFEIK